MFRALMARIHDWFGTKTKSQEDKVNFKPIYVKK